MLSYNTEPNGPWTGYYIHNHNNPTATFLLRTLLENTTFKQQFVNRFADLLNTVFIPKRALERIEAFVEILEPEMQEHIDRWGRPASMTDWRNNVTALRNFARYRPQHVQQHIIDKFNLRGLATLQLEVSNPDHGAIAVNSLKTQSPHTEPWQGAYFKGHPISLSAQAKTGFRFVAWEGIYGMETEQLDLTLNGNLNLSALFTPLTDTSDYDVLPLPFDLASGDYSLNAWNANEPAGSFPENMVFRQTFTRDPKLDTEMESDWLAPYNLESRSRINGLSNDGLAFINTSNPQSDQDGYVGAAVLAIRSIGKHDLQLTWTGSTLIPNNRSYGIRLQYRLGNEGSFNDVVDTNNQPVQYLSSSIQNHSRIIGPISLPPCANDHPYVQICWKYYFVSGDDGPRAQLRLDDILLTSKSLISKATFTSVEFPSSGALILQMAGTANNVYILESSDDLTSWKLVTSLQADTQGKFEFQNEHISQTHSLFYRLRSP